MCFLLEFKSNDKPIFHRSIQQLQQDFERSIEGSGSAAVNVLELKYMPESLLPTLKGFSLYHNSKKILNTDVPTDSSCLNCINGIKYISIDKFNEFV